MLEMLNKYTVWVNHYHAQEKVFPEETEIGGDWGRDN